VLYMSGVAALRRKPVIRAFYQRLRAAGKPAHVAVVACMHKLIMILNAMLQDETGWRPPLLVKSDRLKIGIFPDDLST
jgi:transposase